MDGPFGKTFDGRSVFVTEHTGFKGSWLCLWLERLGARRCRSTFCTAQRLLNHGLLGIVE